MTDLPILHHDAFMSIDDKRGYICEDDENDEDKLEIESEWFLEN